VPASGLIRRAANVSRSSAGHGRRAALIVICPSTKWQRRGRHLGQNKNHRLVGVNEQPPQKRPGEAPYGDNNRLHDRTPQRLVGRAHCGLETKTVREISAPERGQSLQHYSERPMPTGARRLGNGPHSTPTNGQKGMGPT